MKRIDRSSGEPRLVAVPAGYVKALRVCAVYDPANLEAVPLDALALFFAAA